MKKSDTKRELIESVKRLLEKGEDFTVRDIADAAFTNVAAVNYHFGDKNNLVNIAIRELIDDFKQVVIALLDREYADSRECIEAFLVLVGRMYAENKGVLRYIVRTDTGNKGELLNAFLFDEHLTRVVFEKIESMTGETRSEVKQCNYLIALSSFVLPLLFDAQFEDGAGKRGASFAMQDEQTRMVFVTQLMKLFQ